MYVPGGRNFLDFSSERVVKSTSMVPSVQFHRTFKYSVPNVSPGFKAAQDDSIPAQDLEFKSVV